MENQIQFTSPQQSESKSNKKLWIILLILIPLIFFMAIGTKVFLDLRASREKANLIMNKQKNITPESLQRDQQEYMKNYNSTGKSEFFDKCIKGCQSPGSSGCNNNCLTREAVENKDMSACFLIDNSGDVDGKDSGKAGCQSSVAAATLELNNCEKITYGSDSIKEYNRYDCYEKIARAKKDVSICEKISKSYLLGNMYKNCIAIK